MALEEKNKLHFTIGTYPTKILNLDQDIRLLKAALLYADKVELYSLKAFYILLLLGLRDITPEQQLEFIEMIIPYTVSKRKAKETLASLKKCKRVLKNRYLSNRDQIMKKMLLDFSVEQWGIVKNKVTEIAKKAGIDNLNRAIQSGILEIHSFEGYNNYKSILEFATDCFAIATGSSLIKSREQKISERDDKVIQEFVKGLSYAINDGATFPLFDKLTSKFVETQVKVGRILTSQMGINRSKHSGSAGHLLIRLPFFEKASVAEILDIRKELGKYLVRFRQAIIEFSDYIKTAAWDKDFPLEVDKVFHRDVAPAILDIEEEVKSNRFLTSLIHRFIDRPLVIPGGAVISIILSKLSALPDEIMRSLGIAASSAVLVYDAYKEWRQKQQMIEKNGLFFYYQCREKLKET